MDASPIPAAPYSLSPVLRALTPVGVLFSLAMAPFSRAGVVPGRVGLVTVARTRVAFLAVGFTNGGRAVLRNFRGAAGGLLALMRGNRVRFASGLRLFRHYAEYVYEKEVNGELFPGSGFPMSSRLVAIAAQVVEAFPDVRLNSLASDRNARAAGRSAASELVHLYVVFTGRMIYDVARYVSKGVFDVPDAQRFAICELAIMESPLTPSEKDRALSELRGTAPKTTIEFEFYVPLLVPEDGCVADKACRRTAAGDVIDTRAVVHSICDRRAIALAQSITVEAIGLRSLLWLYRDRQVAHDVNSREAWRKFGPDAVSRIAGSPVFPLSSLEIARLTRGGPRPSDEIARIEDRLFRERGLAHIADLILRPPAQKASPVGEAR